MAMAEPETGIFVESTRGKFLISLDGFLYRKNQTSRSTQGQRTVTKSYWICSVDHQRGCRAKLHVLEDTDPPVVISKFVEHNHPPDFNQAGARKVMNKMKKITLETSQSVEEIYDSVITEENPSIEILTALGDRKMVARYLKKMRRRKSEVNISGDPDWNIEFIKNVEKHKAIYDHQSRGFMTRTELNHIWDGIARELGETVADCRDKWRAIKAGYARYLKQNKPAEESWHYMLEHLKFLTPHIDKKTVNSPPSLAIENVFSAASEIKPEPNRPVQIPNPVFGPSPSRSSEEVDVISYHPNTSDLAPGSPTEGDISPSTSTAFPTPTIRSSSGNVSGTSTESSCHHVTDYLRAMRKRKREEEAEDADVGFLKSLIPDFRRMNEEQKHEFKLDVLGSIHRILYNKKQGSGASLLSHS